MNEWTEAELAYFAGIIDGEGCFAMHRHRRNRFGTQLQIGNTDLLLMQWIQQRFGGSLNIESRHSKKHQPVWRWLAASADLDKILQGITPYLISKKRQAELFMAYRATLNGFVKTGHSTAKKSAAVEAERLRIHGELSDLKRPHLRKLSA